MRSITYSLLSFLSDHVRVKQAMVKLDVDPTPPFFGLVGFQIIILMSFESKIFF